MGILELKRSTYPDDLEHIEYRYRNESNYFKNVITPCSSIELYKWAIKLERNIFNLIDSFLPIKENELEGHDELFSLLTLDPNYFFYNNKKICDKFLFMFDDAHKLSEKQRKMLIDYIIEKRGHFNIWISERTEALDPKENVGAKSGRDYTVIDLEKIWQSKPSKYEGIINNIAYRRAQASTEGINSFQENLESDLNEDEYEDKFKEYANAKYEYLLEFISNYPKKFDSWISFFNKFEGTRFDKAKLNKKN